MTIYEQTKPITTTESHHEMLDFVIGKIEAYFGVNF